MNNQDKDLHDAKISELYRQLPDEQPSENTDALIRATARRAVGAGPQKKHLSFNLKQLTATAAVLVLSVGLVVQWQSHEPEKLQEALSSKPAASAPPSPAESAVLEVEPTPERASDRAKASISSKEAMDALAEKPKKNIIRAGSSAPEMPNAAASPMPAPAAPAVIAENRGEADALQDAPASAAKEKLMAREMEKSARRDDAAGALSAQRTTASGMMRERKAEAVASMAAEPQPALADYRTSMARGDYAQALEALQALLQPASAAALFVDRDMLRQLQDPKAAPECAHLSAGKLGEEKPLCDLLGWHAQNKAAAPGWEKSAELQPLISGEKSYRRPALDKLFIKADR